MSRDPVGFLGGDNQYGSYFAIDSLDPLGYFEILTPGTHEIDIPSFHPALPEFVITLTTGEEDAKGCRSLTLSFGATWSILDKILGKLKKVLPKKLFEKIATHAAGLPDVSLQVFVSGTGSYCDCCVDFCEASVTGSVTVGNGSHGGGDSTKPIQIGAWGFISGGINFCTGEFFVTGNVVASISLVAGFDVPFSDNDLEIAFNREFTILDIDRETIKVPGLKLWDGC